MNYDKAKPGEVTLLVGQMVSRIAGLEAALDSYHAAVHAYLLAQLRHQPPVETHEAWVKVVEAHDTEAERRRGS